MKYFYAFIAALNLFNFYTFQDNATWERGLSLACCLLMSLCTVIETKK